MCRKCYVTTPIYYASGTPQLGNSYSTVACDVFARFNRSMGRDTFYLTGMDEHGQKIEEKANAVNTSPKDYVDDIAIKTKKIWEELNISHDYFIRTTDDNHVSAVQKIFETLLANGDIYLGSYTGEYCVSCETFYTQSQLAEGNTCPDCGKITKQVSEESYFLNLKKYSSKLLDYIKTHDDFIRPESRKNEVVSFIESGLEDLCVSRTTFKWGIPVLSNPKHVIYVWIDALANYITALGYNSEDTTNFEKYWVNNDHVYHVIGKDILRFHAIYWPIMLMALNVPINFKLLVHGWILNRDGKMSKSRGNAIYPTDLVNRFGSDSVRYYLAKELPLGNDGLFSPDRFIERYNNELANDLGNLVSRSVAMVIKYFDGIVPSSYKKTPFDDDLERVWNEEINNTFKYFEQFELQDGINATWNIIRRTNKYIDENEPWALCKDETRVDELKSVMYHLIESLRIVSCLVSPYLVNTSKKICEAIGINEVPTFNSLEVLAKYNDVHVVKTDALFKRLDSKVETAYFDELKERELKKLSENKALEESTSNVISIDDFNKVVLKVGKIIDSKKHESADKLLVNQVLIDGQVRQIVSGIAKYYNPSDIIGKKVVVVANLKEATIRGVKSQGMILCTTNKDELELVEVNLPEGSVVR